MASRLVSVTFVGVIAFLLGVGFVPVVGAYSARPFHEYGLVNPDGCTVTWNVCFYYVQWYWFLDREFTAFR
jgi:hypothetical protein